MKFFVCAGEREDAAALRLMLERRLAELCGDIETECFFSADELLAAGTPGACSVLLLDADMDGGLAAAKLMRQRDPACQLIIYAADAAHALRSYPLHPVGYFIKPFDYEILIRTLDWCRSSWSAGLRSLEVSVRRNTVRLLLSDILYAEVTGRNLRIRTRQTEILTALSLSEFCRRAGGRPFLRCHKSFVVSLSHVVGAEDGRFLMDDGGAVPISTDRRREVLAQYAGAPR